MKPELRSYVNIGLLFLLFILVIVVCLSQFSKDYMITMDLDYNQFFTEETTAQNMS